LESGEFVAGHRDIEFWTACHVRLIFAIVTRMRNVRDRCFRAQGLAVDPATSVDRIPSLV
jgi:hypothetical protein